MKTFKDFMNEATLKKDSIMFNGKPSSEINIGYKGNTLSIWVNGGSPYIFEIDPVAGKNFEDLESVERQKIAEDLALKVAKLLEKEVSALESKLKSK